MKIITADQRLSEQRGAKILVVGPTGVGKTSLLRTLDPERTLFLDIEAGDLSVLDVSTDTIRVDDWPAARDLACRIGGPNPSYSPDGCYSDAHFSAIGGAFDLSKYQTVFVDSITALSRLSFRWAEQQPGSRREFWKEGSARRLRTSRPRNDRVAEPASARPRHVRHIRRHSREGRRRPQNLDLAAADGRQQNLQRAPWHRRSNRHDAVDRFRRWRSGTRIYLHVAEPLGLSGQGPFRSTSSRSRSRTSVK